MKLDYNSAVNWLFQQFPAFQKKGAMAYHPTLDNVWELVYHFDINLKSLKFIHVAGTNGKGSTCSYISAVLSYSNYKVGLFTSPHIFDFRERIRINGVKIEKKLVVDFVENLQREELKCKPSFFELTWVLALKYFQDKNCDFVVVETGIGGRLDATNIISPLVTAITNIGLDHESILGNSKREIALEKAGIIKSNVPLILGEKNKILASVIAEVAKQKNSEVIPVNSKTNSFQEQNKCLAKRVLDVLVDQKDAIINFEDLELTDEQVQKVTGFSYRFQQVGKRPTLIFDVAHNIDGVLALFQQIKGVSYHAIHLIYGASADKNILEITKNFPENAYCYFTTFTNSRSFKLKSLKKHTKHLHQEKTYFEDINAAINSAKSNASQNDLILVFGSFFMFEDVNI